MRIISGISLLLTGLVLLGVGLWRFWVCFYGPDELLRERAEKPSVLETHERDEAHRRKILELIRTKAPASELAAERKRHQEAKTLEQRERAEQFAADAPRVRQFEFALGCIALIGSGLFLGDGWRRLRGGSPQPAVADTAAVPPDQS